MSNVTIVALAALLGAVLLVIVAIMLVQESRRRPSREPAEFVIEDAAGFVWEALRDERPGLERASVLAVIEWHMQWVTEQIRAGRAPVVGLTDEAVHYIDEQAPDVATADVEAVLSHVGDYVASIGAVGPAF